MVGQVVGQVGLVDADGARASEPYVVPAWLGCWERRYIKRFCVQSGPLTWQLWILGFRGILARRGTRRYHNETRGLKNRSTCYPFRAIDVFFGDSRAFHWSTRVSKKSKGEDGRFFSPPSRKRLCSLCTKHVYREGRVAMPTRCCVSVLTPREKRRRPRCRCCPIRSTTRCMGCSSFPRAWCRRRSRSFHNG